MFHIIIPTHNAHDTLFFAVQSALNQTLPPDKITIIGDGVSQKVRKVATELESRIGSVEFLDKPKLQNRGEKYRDEVIKTSESLYITYLCDDDLFLPDHLESMSRFLKQYDFVHPRPTFVNPDSGVFFLPSGIEIPKIRFWHRLEPQQNTISLTGASHSKAAYLQLEKGWEPGPENIWTDLFMWVKFFENSKLTTFTVPQTTTVKLMYTKRQRDTLMRKPIISHWYEIISQPKFLSQLKIQFEDSYKESHFNEHHKVGELQAIIDRGFGPMSKWKLRKSQQSKQNETGRLSFPTFDSK